MEPDMGHREDMLQLVHAAYAARAEGDVEGLVTAFRPEGVFTLVGDDSALALTGSVQGHSKLREAFGQFVAGFGFVEREILSELVDGPRVAVHSRLVVRYHPTETTFSTDALDLFTFEDGKIVELVEFADTAKIKVVMA
jgi:ketosteroid isomerase-like protein